MARSYLDTSIRRIPVQFYSRTLVDVVGGRKKAQFTKIEGVSLTNFKTRGGTQSVVDGVLQIIDTASINMNYRPDIKRGDRVECLMDGSTWEILNIENVDMMNLDFILTVQSCEGVG